MLSIIKIVSSTCVYRQTYVIKIIIRVITVAVAMEKNTNYSNHIQLK